LRLCAGIVFAPFVALNNITRSIYSVVLSDIINRFWLGNTYFKNYLHVFLTFILISSPFSAIIFMFCGTTLPVIIVVLSDKGGNHEEIIDAAACRYRGIPP
jgi:hypothetical protein